jgi:hypothetical protein
MVMRIIVGLVLATALLLIGICYPKLSIRAFQPLLDIIKLGRSSESEIKPRKLSPNQTLIDQLAFGQMLRNTISEKRGGRFLDIEVNPDYPRLGKKYMVSIEKAYNGLPNGNKNLIDESDYPIDVDKSVSDREGDIFVLSKVMSEKVKQKEPVGVSDS